MWHIYRTSAYIQLASTRAKCWLHHCRQLERCAFRRFNLKSCLQRACFDAFWLIHISSFGFLTLQLLPAASNNWFFAIALLAPTVRLSFLPPCTLATFHVFTSYILSRSVCQPLFRHHCRCHLFFFFVRFFFAPLMALVLVYVGRSWWPMRPAWSHLGGVDDGWR